MAPVPTMSNREIEDAAIRLVLAHEAAAGRAATDTRHRNAPTDIDGDRLIEVKACGGSARGTDLWLETRQVEAALREPDRFHLMIVENVRTGTPRILDLHGPQLAALLERRRVKTYVEVPFPTGTYDTLAADITGSD